MNQDLYFLRLPVLTTQVLVSTGHFFFNLGLIIFFLLLKLKAAGGSRTFDYGTEKGGLVSGGGHWHLSGSAAFYFF